MLLIAESITCCCVLESYGSGDITGVNFIYILSVVSVHLKNTSETLISILNRVVNSCACLNST